MNNINFYISNFLRKLIRFLLTLWFILIKTIQLQIKKISRYGTYKLLTYVK